MIVSHPLEDVPSTLNSQLAYAWKKYRGLDLFEIRALQKAHRFDLNHPAEKNPQKRCRLAVLEALEGWKRRVGEEPPRWNARSTEHLKYVRERLIEHGLIEKKAASEPELSVS